MENRIGKTPSISREFSSDDRKRVIWRGGEVRVIWKSTQIRTEFWGIWGVDSLSVEVGRRSTCVTGFFSAIDGARAPTRRLVVLESVVDTVLYKASPRLERRRYTTRPYFMRRFGACPVYTYPPPSPSCRTRGEPSAGKDLAA